MFTGIVQQLGTVDSFRPAARGGKLAVDLRGWSHRPEPGDSIAVNGCCLTVTEPGVTDGRVCFDVVRQTLDLTTLGALAAGDPVNLEHAVTPTGLLGGHLVHGHVDGIGQVRGVTRGDGDWRVRIEPPASLMAYIMDKGSIAVDGVSLTIAAAHDPVFEVALIPTTLDLTTLGRLDVGNAVNLEADCVARTIVGWLERRGGP